MLHAPKSFCIFAWWFQVVSSAFKYPFNWFLPISRLFLLTWISHISGEINPQLSACHIIQKPSCQPTIHPNLSAGRPYFPRNAWRRLLGARTPHPSLISPWKKWHAPEEGQSMGKRQGDLSKANQAAVYNLSLSNGCKLSLTTKHYLYITCMIIIIVWLIIFMIIDNSYFHMSMSSFQFHEGCRIIIFMIRRPHGPGLPHQGALQGAQPIVGPQTSTSSALTGLPHWSCRVRNFSCNDP